MPHPPGEVAPFEPYPSRRVARDAWVLSRRPARRAVDPFQPHAALIEHERGDRGVIVRVAVVFLTNRECPWRCVYCDLWKTTLKETVPVGAIPTQIDRAFGRLGLARSPARKRDDAVAAPRDTSPRVRHIKLYNSGSFFDPRAIPPFDYLAIADRMAGFERMIVECHPAFVGDSCVEFRDLLFERAARNHRAGPDDFALEIAMGLETVHPGVLEKLNKGMTLDQFGRAAEFLRRNGIALRAFVLVKPPFMDEDDALEWAQRSIDFAFDAGASAVSLIPVRPGNGALEALQVQREFLPPKLATLEAALNYGVRLRRGRVFADLWDLARFSDCPGCFDRRLERMRRVNLEQAWEAPVTCSACGAG